MYATGVGITLAIIMVAIGGMIWLTSAGSPDKIGQAKSYITGAVLGLVLLLGSYIVLNSINTGLTELNAIKTEIIRGIEYGCCQYTENDGDTNASTETELECTNILKGLWYGTKQPTIDNKQCELVGCCQRLNDTTTGTEICFASGKSRCDQEEIQSNRQTIPWPKTCDRVPSCSDKTGECLGVDDGEQCNGESGSWANRKCWCYKEIAYVGVGAIGEPCGPSGKNGICKVNTDFITGIIDHLITGSRSCETPTLVCAYLN